MTTTTSSTEPIALEESKTNQLFIVLPCFNEERNLVLLVNRIYSSVSSNCSCVVIAVDDGSNDRTSATILNLAKTFPQLSLIRHRHNQGIGPTIKTGVLFALRRAARDDPIVIMDADNTHDPSMVMEMVTCLGNTCDVIVASRYIKGGSQLGLSSQRVILSKILNIAIRLLIRLPVHDATSGYRAYRASVLGKVFGKNKRHPFESAGFEASLEILAKAYWSGARLCEIPFRLEYGRKMGDSKMHLLPTMRGYLRLFFELTTWNALRAERDS